MNDNDLGKKIRPKFLLHHANGKCTGGAVAMSLHPAHDKKEGFIMLGIARQKTVGNRQGPTPTFSTFDWDNKIVVKLDFIDVCKMLQVLRGENESVEEGRGMIHHSACGVTKIVFRHMLEPITGYSLEIYRRKDGEANDVSAHFTFFPHEAIGVALVFEQIMMYITVGVPELVLDDVLRHEQEVRYAALSK